MSIIHEQIDAPEPKVFQQNPDAWIKENIHRDQVSRIFIPNDKGILTFLVGLSHQFKGYPFPRVVDVVQIAKKLIPVAIQVISSSPLRYFLLIGVLLPRFIRNKILIVLFDGLIEFWETILERYYLEPHRFCRSAREIYRLGMIAKERFPKEGIRIRRITLTICMFWEFDNSYRYRGQDIFGEMDIKAFKKNPRKEVCRLLDILYEREWGPEKQGDPDMGIWGKWKRIRKLTPIVFLIFRKELQPIFEIIQEADLEEFKLDEGDLYLCAVRPDYKFQGRGYSDRRLERLKNDKSTQFMKQQIEEQLQAVEIELETRKKKIEEYSKEVARFHQEIKNEDNLILKLEGAKGQLEHLLGICEKIIKEEELYHKEKKEGTVE